MCCAYQLQALPDPPADTVMNPVDYENAAWIMTKDGKSSFVTMRRYCPEEARRITWTQKKQNILLEFEEGKISEAEFLEDGYLIEGNFISATSKKREYADHERAKRDYYDFCYGIKLSNE